MKATTFAIIFFFSFFFSFKQKEKIAIISYGYTPSDTALNIIKNKVWEVFHVKAMYVAIDSLPDSITHNEAENYKKSLLTHLSEKYTKVVGLADVYMPDFDPNTFLFSRLCGQTWGNTSIVSTIKVDSVTDSTISYVVCHELGHQFRIPHCSDSLCLMWPEDKGNSELCKRCKKLLKKILKPK